MKRNALSATITAALAIVMIACTPIDGTGDGTSALGGATEIPTATGGNIGAGGSTPLATGGTTTVVSTGGSTGVQQLCIPTSTGSGCQTPSGATGTLVCNTSGMNWDCIANAIPTGGNTGNGGATTVTSTGGSTVVTSTGGNSATGGSTTVLDTVSPLVSNVSVGSFAVNVLDGFSVNAWDNVMVVNCDLVLDGTNVGGMLPPSGDKPVLAGNGVWGTTWMFRVPGVHNVAVTCKDAAGNKTTSQSVMFMVANPVISTGGTTCSACNGTGGTTGAAGSSGSGGTTATGGSSSTNVGGMCGGIDPNSTVSCGSFTFTRSWIGKPVYSGTTSAKWCFNPAFLLKDEYGVSRSCPTVAISDVYNDEELGASASIALDNIGMTITADGACLSFAGQPDGVYHTSYMYPGLVNIWAYYPPIASCAAITDEAAQWVERRPNRGSYGLTFKLSNGGITFVKNPDTGGKYPRNN